jgi:hypothetical protein
MHFIAFNRSYEIFHLEIAVRKDDVQAMLDPTFIYSIFDPCANQRSKWRA